MLICGAPLLAHNLPLELYRRLVCAGLQEGQNLAEALGFAEIPGPVAQLVVKRPHLGLTIPSVKDQAVAIKDFANITVSVHSEIYTVC